ncbi:hypothetical protein M408DRAFT_124138 [Serendipita vermifera MAFF 305830]|uniref:Uncharacterized protein n=1 Tax=Serendipita vermifera MAFF 305830 TaxID=933852 RepID=A0A0C3AL41_SERVB|nr:hypothetical protein M408DRAFT_124138 [Serendipita vermifera MAFF 305830]
MRDRSGLGSLTFPSSTTLWISRIKSHLLVFQEWLRIRMDIITVSLRKRARFERTARGFRRC